MRRLCAAFIILLGLANAALAQVVTTKPFPDGQAGRTNNLVASATGTTGAIAATLTGVANATTYICGFTVTSAGTTAATLGNVTITGLPTTMNFTYAFVSSGQGVMGVQFTGCLAASAQNTNIVVNVPAGGAGTTVAANAWGYTN